MKLGDYRLTFGRYQLYLEPRDAWIGVYVAPDAVYVCPLPWVVLKVWRKVRPSLVAPVRCGQCQSIRHVRQQDMAAWTRTHHQDCRAIMGLRARLEADHV